MKCVFCDGPVVNAEEVFKCCKCKDIFHPACIGVREEKFRNLTTAKKQNWICPKCKVGTINPPAPSTKSPTIPACESVSQINSNPGEEGMVNILKKLFEEKLDDLKKYIRDELADVKQSIEFNSNSIKDLTEKNTSLEKEIANLNSTLQTTIIENHQLKTQIEDLAFEIIDLQQYSRRANIEITEVPESTNENTIEIVNKIFNTLELTEVCNIQAAHRIPTRNPMKRKPIIVQLQSKSDRDRVIKQYKEKKLTAKDLNSELDAAPIFISEHLCPAMKKLYFEARQFKKKNNFKFCWVKDSKIFLRQNEQSKPLRIRKTSDLSMR